MKLNRSAFLFPAIGLGLWLTIGLGLVPPLLEVIVTEWGLPFLSDALAANPDAALNFLLGEWYGIVFAGTAAILFLAALANVLGRKEMADRFVGEASPADLGAIRMLVCAVLLISVVWEDLASTASLPREMIRPMGVIQVLYVVPGFERFLQSELALRLLEWVTAGLLIMGMIGWKTRVVLPCGAVAYLIVGGLLRQYAWFYHTGLLALYLLIVLSMLPANHGASVDRLVKLWKGERVPGSEATRHYGWMRYALWTTLALPYVAAGLSKMRNGGLMWWEASNFKFILFQSALRPMEFDFDVSLLLTSAPDVVFEVLGASALAGELLYGLVLFSRTARWVMPATMALMHVGILLLQNILFFDLIVLQAIFFNVRPLLQRIRDALARRWGRVQLVYDPAVGSHGRLVRMVAALDVLDRFDLQARDGLGRLEAIGRGRLYLGAAVYHCIAQSLPVLWWLTPAVRVSAISRLIEHRLSSSNPDSTPPLPQPASIPHRPQKRIRQVGPRFIVAMAGVLIFSWVFRIEFYPMTGMQMFSNKRTQPVAYEKIFARFGSGAVTRAPIEKCIGAMSDSRYRRVMQMAFDPEGEDLAASFLDSCRVRWNRGARHPSDRIESFEVQQWEWYYLTDPDDPEFGKMMDRRIFPQSDDPRNETRGSAGSFTLEPE